MWALVAIAGTLWGCQAISDALTPEVNCKEQCPCECQCDDDKADKTDKTATKDQDKDRNKDRDKDLELPSDGAKDRPYAVFLAGNVVVAEGDMPREQARDIISSQRLGLQSCYDKALIKEPDLKGEMSMQWTASTRTGTVIAAVVRKANIERKPLERCLTGKIRAWEFEPRAGGQESVIRFDVVMLGVNFDSP